MWIQGRLSQRLVPGGLSSNDQLDEEMAVGERGLLGSPEQHRKIPAIPAKPLSPHNGGLLSVPDNTPGKDSNDEIFGNLAEFVQEYLRVNSRKEKSLSLFLASLRKNSLELSHNPEMKKFFNESTLSARDASARIEYFDSNRSDLEILYRIWDYCKSMESPSEKFGEVVLSDTDMEVYLPIEIAILAILSCNFENGVEGMYTAIIRVALSEESAESFLEALSTLFGEESATNSLWDVYDRSEDALGIPDPLAHIFPCKVKVYSFKSEGLSISGEKMACVLMYFHCLSFSRSRCCRAMYCSHLLIRDERGLLQLTEDFFFNFIPLENTNSRSLYVTVESRCITDSPSAAFLVPCKENGRLGVMHGPDEMQKRWWQYVTVAKYNISMSDLTFLYEQGITPDHLVCNVTYSQATLLQLANWEQQALNKRPRSRSTFLLDSVIDDPLYTSACDLGEGEEAIVESCKECIANGLPMARLKTAVNLSDIGPFRESSASEKWCDLITDDHILYFPDQQAIWNRNTNSWIFLEDRVFKTCARLQYRFLSISGVKKSLHTSVCFTVLHDHVLQGKGAEMSALKQEDILVRNENGQVQVRYLWKDESGNVRRITCHHKDENKGNNTVDNLALVSDKANISASCAIPRQVTIHPYQRESNVDSIVIRGSSAIETVFLMKQAMSSLGFPPELQEYPDKTLCNWIWSTKVPEQFQGFISIDRVEKEVEMYKINNRNMHWYGVVFESISTRAHTLELCIGREKLFSTLRETLQIPLHVDLRRIVVQDIFFILDEGDRRTYIASDAVKKHLISGNGTSSDFNLVDLFPLFDSTCSNTSSYDLKVGEVYIYSCAGYSGLIKNLKAFPDFMAAIQEQYEGQEVIVDFVLRNLIQSAIQNQNSGTLLSKHGVEIVQRSGKKKLVAARPTSKTFGLIMQSGNVEHRSVKDIQDRLQVLLGQDHKEGKIRDWLQNKTLTSALQEIGVRGFPAAPAAAPTDLDDVSDTVTIKATIRYVLGTDEVTKGFQTKQAAVDFVKEKLGFTAGEVLKLDRGLVLSNDKAKNVTMEYEKQKRVGQITRVFMIVSHEMFPGCRPEDKVNHHDSLPDFIKENVEEAMNKIIFQDKTTVAEIRKKMHSGEYRCLSVLGFEMLESFLSGTCDVPDASQQIKAAQRRGFRGEVPVQGAPWCRYIFTERLIKNAMSKNSSIRTSTFDSTAYIVRALTEDFVSEGIHSLIKSRMSPSAVARPEMFQIVREIQSTFTHRQALGEKASTNFYLRDHLVQHMWERLGNRNKAGTTDQSKSIKPKPLWTVVNAKMKGRWGWCLPSGDASVPPERIPFLYRSLKKKDFIVREGDAEGAIDNAQNLYVVVVSKTPMVEEEVPSSG